MFSKAKTSRSADDRAAANGADAPRFAPPAKSEPASTNTRRGAPAPKPSGMPSLISADMVIHGNISTTGEVQLDGALEGDLKAGSLIVGEKATVKGEIVCDNIMVRGSVTGGIRAKQVALAATAHIEGDILHSALSIESGAHFEGNCRHSDDPLSEASANDYRKSRPTAPPPPVPGARATAPTGAGRSMANGTDAPAGEPAGAGSDTPSFLSQSRSSPLR